MKLTTKIIDKDTGKEYIASAGWVYKTIANCAGDSQADIYATESETGKCFRVGSMVYTKKEGHIHIEYIRNSHSYLKHIGTAGIEYLLRLPGVTKITTDASYRSHIFYVKLGFCVPSEYAIWTPEGRKFNKIYTQYTQEKDVVKQAELAKSIVLDKDFESDVISHVHYVAGCWEMIARHEGSILSLQQLALTKISKQDLFTKDNSGLIIKDIFKLVMDIYLYEDRSVVLASRIYRAIEAYHLSPHSNHTISFLSDYKKYSAEQEPAEKERLRKLIIKNPCFKGVLDRAKNALDMEDTIVTKSNFDLIMKTGTKLPINNNDYADAGDLGSIILELPPEAINKLKKKFQIVDPQVTAAAPAPQVLADYVSEDTEQTSAESATFAQCTR
jgi:hypothetical protein